jgi:hypothetical protein
MLKRLADAQGIRPCQRAMNHRAYPIAKTAAHPGNSEPLIGLGPGPESVQCMGNKNSDAQNNQKCGNSFKHRRILRNRPIERSAFYTVKEIRLSG